MLEILYFTATWCGPCRAFKPVMNEAINMFAGQVNIRIIDVDDNAAMAQQHNVSSIPTIIFIKDGQVVHQTRGVMPKTSLIQLINQYK